MMKIEVKGLDGIAKRLRQIADPHRRNIALSMAVNKAITKAKTEMVRAITQEYQVKRAVVEERLKVHKASAKGGSILIQATLAASNRAKGRSMNMIHFLKGKRHFKWGSGKALQVQIKRRGGRKALPGAWVGNSGRTVFIRKGTERMPIRVMNTIDIPQMFNARMIKGRVVKAIRATLKVEVERAVTLMLKKDVFPGRP